MLNHREEATYNPLSLRKVFKASLNEGVCRVRSEVDEVLEVRASKEEKTLILSKFEGTGGNRTHLLLIAIEYLLGHFPELHEVKLDTLLSAQYPFDHLGTHFSRSEFSQIPLLWHHRGHNEIRPEKWTTTKDRHHPVRPLPHQGEAYRRYLPSLKATLSFRLIDLERDLEIFHRWHNSPRVSHFWELNQSMPELKTYLERGLLDPHQIPMIVEINGEPLGYYEMYWVREDRLGPIYESDAFDRGFHFLIGNKSYLGHKTTDAVIKSGLHFLYLDEPRTRRVMAEPRHDNQKVLKYAEASAGWRKVKLFDFPHKRAWLLENSREIFFEGNSL